MQKLAKKAVNIALLHAVSQLQSAYSSKWAANVCSPTTRQALPLQQRSEHLRALDPKAQAIRRHITSTGPGPTQQHLSEMYWWLSLAAASRLSSVYRSLWCASYRSRRPSRISYVSSTDGSGTYTGWNRL